MSTGKPSATADWDYPIGFSGDLQIGTWGNPQTCHHGLIDEVKLYNRALTPEEVLADFQRTAAGRGPAGPGEQAYEKIPAKAAGAGGDPRQRPDPSPARRSRTGHRLGGQGHRQEPLAPGAGVFRHDQERRRDVPAIRCARTTAASSRFAFGKSGVTAQVQVSCQAALLRLRVGCAVSDPEVDEAVIGGLAVDLAKDMSASVAWASDGEFAAAVVPLNLQVEVGLAGRNVPGVLAEVRAALRPAGGQDRVGRMPDTRSARSAQGGRAGRGPALVARWAGRSRWTPRRTAAPTCSPPSPRATWTSGSSWGVAAASRRSTSAPGGTGWATTSPTPACIPHGLAGLKQVTDKLHAAGFKVGMHTLTGCIQVDDPWVSPVPDKRLTKDARFTLAARGRSRRQGHPHARASRRASRPSGAT